MDVFRFDRVTGEYRGPCKADPHPLKNGEWIVPGYSTPKMPPTTNVNQTAVFDKRAGSWSVVADFRGQTYWLIDGSEYQITELAITKPVGALDEKPAQPPLTPEELATIERAWRDAEMAVADRCFTPDYGPVGWTAADRAAAQDKIIAFRAELKKGPNSHIDFPAQSWRPDWPAGCPRPTS